MIRAGEKLFEESFSPAPNVIQLSLPPGGGGGVADGEGGCPLTRPGRELSQRESHFVNLMTLPSHPSSKTFIKMVGWIFNEIL
jgi:hypothetical protein